MNLFWTPCLLPYISYLYSWILELNHLQHCSWIFEKIQKKFNFWEKYFLKISACLKLYVFCHAYSTMLCSTLWHKVESSPSLSFGNLDQGCWITVSWWSSHHLFNWFQVMLFGNAFWKGKLVKTSWYGLIFISLIEC